MGGSPSRALCQKGSAGEERASAPPASFLGGRNLRAAHFGRERGDLGRGNPPLLLNRPAEGNKVETRNARGVGGGPWVPASRTLKEPGKSRVRTSFVPGNGERGVIRQSEKPPTGISEVLEMGGALTKKFGQRWRRGNRTRPAGAKDGGGRPPPFLGPQDWEFRTSRGWTPPAEAHQGGRGEVPAPPGVPSPDPEGAEPPALALTYSNNTS